jgi:hypothetical protein
MAGDDAIDEGKVQVVGKSRELRVSGYTKNFAAEVERLRAILRDKNLSPDELRARANGERLYQWSFNGQIPQTPNSAP